MPLIKSAIKKVRKDKLRTARNTKRELTYRKSLKLARRTPSAQNLTTLFFPSG